MVVAHELTVINQYAYVNHYRGDQVGIVEAVLRELKENPAKPTLTWLSIDSDGRAQAHFKVKPRSNGSGGGTAVPGADREAEAHVPAGRPIVPGAGERRAT